MEFKDKLIELRKNRNISQETLAEELEVTRQTVSKWELGQSKPDMDKLLALSKYYGMSIEQLTCETEKSEEFKPITEQATITKTESGRTKERNQRKGLMYFLVVILIAAVIGLVFNINYENKKAAKENNGNSGIFGFFDNIFSNSSVEDDIKEQEEQEEKNREELEKRQNEMIEKGKINSFNMGFSFAEGTKTKLELDRIIDNVVTSNKKNSDHIITVVFSKKTYTNANDIKNVKKKIKAFPVKYEVSVDYDETGYVNKITIEKY